MLQGIPCGRTAFLRALLIHRYFWPDSPPYASMLGTIGADLAAAGHDVAVITGQPSRTGDQAASLPSREQVGALAVRRLPVAAERPGGRGQLVNLVAFPLAVAGALALRPRPDVVMCSTAPQVTLGAVVSLVARIRRVPFVYHCMDLHPEIGRISGEFTNPVLYRVLAWLDRATMRRSSAVVVLSGDMRRSVLLRDPRLADRVVVINNFALPDDGGHAPTPLPPPDPGVLRVVFTGNIGRFQGLENAVAALGRLPGHVRVELVFMGDGRALIGLAEDSSAYEGVSNISILFVPRGSAEAARELMRSAHLGLVSLVPGVVRYAYPSKTATYAEEGLPLLVVCEGDSELAATVAERGLGWTATPGNPETIAVALTSAWEELTGGDRFVTLRARVRGYAEESFTESALLPRWRELLATVAAPGKARS